MKMCVNFDHHRGPHHFLPGMYHFRRYPYGGHPHWNFCHRRREGPFHHGGPPHFSHALPPFMFMGPHCQHNPHRYEADHCKCRDCHSRRNNDRPGPHPLSGRPSSCPPFDRPPFDRPPFGDTPFDRSTRGREPFGHPFEMNCCHLPHRCGRANHQWGHCGNSSSGR